MGNSYYNGLRDLTMDDLLSTFAMATRDDFNYVGLLVTVPNSDMPEVIITHKANFYDKSYYYSQAYDKDLVLKANPKIQIIGFTPANSFEDIEAILI